MTIALRCPRCGGEIYVEGLGIEGEFIACVNIAACGARWNLCGEPSECESYVHWDVPPVGDIAHPVDGFPSWVRASCDDLSGMPHEEHSGPALYRSTDPAHRSRRLTARINTRITWMEKNRK